MPTYEFKCDSCEKVFDRFLWLRDREKPQACPECSSTETRQILTSCNFVLKGDSWPGKAMKINRQMTEKNKRLNKKQNERKRDAPPVTLAPNVGGERVDTWSEARSLAASKGKDTSSYDPYVRAEKSKK